MTTARRLVACLVLLLPAAGAYAAVTRTGSLNPMIANLYYETQSQKGYTSAAGKFRYRPGETITLSYAGVQIAAVPAAPIITVLDMSNTAAARNQLHLLQALDTNSVKAGIQLRKLAKAGRLAVDYTDNTAVASALAVLKPAATLPAGDETADNSQIAAAQAAVQSVTTAFQPVSYQSYRITRMVGSDDFGVTAATASFSAPFKMAAAPDSEPVLAKGASFAGHLDITLADTSVVSLDISSASGDITLNDNPVHYRVSNSGFCSDHDGRILTLYLYNGTTLSDGTTVAVLMRNPAKKNLPPLAGGGSYTVYPPMPGQTLTLYKINLEDSPSPLCGYDLDGKVASIQWQTSDGQTGSNTLFQYQRFLGQQITVTETITDDEGQSSTRSWTEGKPLTVKDAVGLLAGKSWLESASDPDYDYYYRLTGNQQQIVEIEYNKTGKTCQTTGQISVSAVASAAKYAFFPSVSTMVYEGPDMLGISPVVSYTYTQASLPAACAALPLP